MVDVMEDGTFSATITPGDDRPHPVLPGRHQTRVAILDDEGNIVEFMDSEEFMTEQMMHSNQLLRITYVITIINKEYVNTEGKIIITTI